MWYWGSLDPGIRKEKISFRKIEFFFYLGTLFFNLKFCIQSRFSDEIMRYAKKRRKEFTGLPAKSLIYWLKIAVDDNTYTSIMSFKVDVYLNKNRTIGVGLLYSYTK